MTRLYAGAVAALLFALPSTAALAHNGVIHTGCPYGQTFSAGGITVTGAFIRATLKGAQSAGGYLTVTNTGGSSDTFTGATSQAANDIALHQMKIDNGVMIMSPVEGGLEIAPGASVTLDPKGYHLMMTGMEQPFIEGQCVEMTLHFANAGDLPIQLNIGGPGQMMPPAGPPDGGASSAPMDDMSGMDMGSSSSMAM